MFDRYSTAVAARDESGRLVGWCALVSDGVRHAFFVDVVVHREVQRSGIGKVLIEHAIRDARGQGISLLHVDFAPDNRESYERCGFAIGSGGYQILR